MFTREKTNKQTNKTKQNKTHRDRAAIKNNKKNIYRAVPC